MVLSSEANVLYIQGSNREIDGLQPKSEVGCASALVFTLSTEVGHRRNINAWVSDRRTEWDNKVCFFSAVRHCNRKESAVKFIFEKCYTYFHDRKELEEKRKKRVRTIFAEFIYTYLYLLFYFLFLFIYLSIYLFIVDFLSGAASWLIQFRHQNSERETLS